MDVRATNGLKRAGLSLPPLGLGGGPLGGLFQTVDEHLAATTLKMAWDAGLRYFDTAPWYGLGQSEHRMGRFLYQQPRDEFIISTKVGRILRPSQAAPATTKGNWHGALPFDVVFDYGYEGIMRSYEDSLQRLGLNRVDAVIVHDLDYWHHRTDATVNAHLGALFTSGYRALEELKTAGEIRAIGIGINAAGMVERFLEMCTPDFFLIAMRYTLLDQDALEIDFPLCEQRSVDVVIGSVFGSGILATGSIAGAKYGYEEASPDRVNTVVRIEQVCDHYGVTLRSAAIQFPLHHPVVASVIPGALGAQQIAENVQAFRTPIPNDFWAELKARGLLRADALTGN